MGQREGMEQGDLEAFKGKKTQGLNYPLPCISLGTSVLISAHVN